MNVDGPSSPSAAPLSAEAVDRSPGRFGLRAAVSTKTSSCTSCGAPADGTTPLSWQIPPWFHIGGAVFFGLAYYGAVERLWFDGPLGAANQTHRGSALHTAVLQVAPALLPLLFMALLGVLGFILFRARELRVSSCSDCRKRERRARLLFASAGPALVVIAVLALHPLSALHLPILAVGVVLLPFAFARGVLRRLLPGVEGAVAIGRDKTGAWQVRATAMTERVLLREAPAALVPEEPRRRVYLLGWALPFLIALFVNGALPTVVRGYACPYGAIPMQWTENVDGLGERHKGCMTPTGKRHGPWRGSRQARPLWEATFHFDAVDQGTARRVVDGSLVPASRFFNGVPVGSGPP